ncbi:alpha/beta fold hydrolase [Phytomonospora sp. NPDC050363]|uniref:alpha/beta fold hydrolase n=1 Tax=Phytomonospora sp. NPDC050363 TaxID=3155642 RepID=UPI0033D36B54
MHPAIFIDTPRLRFAYRTWGPAEGAPLLLLHGASGSGAAWEEVVEALSPRWRVYAPDARGHGASAWPGEYSFEAMRDDVAAFMDALGIASAVVAGHSMGGIAAHLFAAARPERVAGLLLIETPPPVPLGIAPPVRPEGELDYDWALRPQVIGQLNDPSSDRREGSAAITAPTLVVAGGESSHLPQDQIAAMAGRIPGARLTEIPVGHLVVGKAPAELAALIDGFAPARPPARETRP